MKLKEKTVSFMINGVNLKINIDDYILNALKEDITSDVKATLSPDNNTLISPITSPI